jgi:hypothetical protein
MADIDIDKILEQTEKKEKSAKNRRLVIISMAGVIAAALVTVGIIAALKIIGGEDSSPYMPLRSAEKLLYNRIGGATEKWQALEKTEVVDGIECRVMNVIDQSNFFSYQYYYYTSEQGIVLYVTSENFGEKNRAQMIILPPRITGSKSFSAGTVRGKEITATLTVKEEVMCPAGIMDSVRVDYKADGVLDRTVWYVKDTGIVKITDRIKNEELILLAVEK